MRAPGARPRLGERGQTLLQLMMAVALMSILAALTAKLLQGVLNSWAKGQAGLAVHQGSRATRDLVVNGLRNASASSIIITRADALQPPMSKLCYVDAGGTSLTVFQSGKRLIRGTWTSTTATVTNQTVVMNDYVERFMVYYPNVKVINQVAFSLSVRARPLATNSADITLLTTGDVEMKAP